MTIREKIEAVRNVQNYEVEIEERLEQIIHDTCDDHIRGIDNFSIEDNAIIVNYWWTCRGETSYDTTVIPIEWLDDGFDYKSAYQEKVRLAQEKAKKEEAQNEQYKNIELGNLLFGHSRGNFALPRDKYGDSFNSFLVQGGFDSYGRPNDCGVSANWMYDCGDGRFENDVFVLRAYYWGNDERVARLPNFLHKPSGYEIRWYKYPLRDAYASQKLEIGDFNRILNECLASIGCLPF